MSFTPSLNLVVIKGFVGAWLLILLWLFVFLFALNLYMRQRRVDIPICVTIAVVYLLLQWQMKTNTDIGVFVTLAMLCILLSAWGGYFVYKAYVWQRTHISNISVKQAVDKIPFGVCYYNNQGRILLINQTMTILCEEIIGEQVQNGLRTFEKILSMGPVIHMQADRVISVQSQKCVIDTEEVELVTAFDISEEYKKTNILMQKEEELKNLNRKLVSYNKEMVSVIALREVLNAKVKIHDELGSSLLATKKYILQGGSPEERNHLIDSLRKNVRFLRQESEEVTYDEYEMIMNTASDIGMQVDINGELPVEEQYRHIVATAMHECLTNTIRHAGGDKLYVEIENAKDRYRLVYTNNGTTPDEPVSEKGGLNSLRNLVEQAGGTMQITVIGQFALIIELPKEKINGSKSTCGG